MHVSAVKQLKLPREWLKVNGMVRVVTNPDGVDVLEVKAVPNSVRRRKKRRKLDAGSSEGV